MFKSKWEGSSVAGQTLFHVWGCGRNRGGEKESGVSVPYSVASAGMWADPMKS